MELSHSNICAPTKREARRCKRNTRSGGSRARWTKEAKERGWPVDGAKEGRKRRYVGLAVSTEQYNVGGYRCFCIYRSTGREGSHIRAKSHRSPSILSSYSLPTRESEREPWTSATTGRGAPIASSTCRSAGSANAATHRSKF